MTIKLSGYEMGEQKDHRVTSIESWWENAHREWAICLKDSEGTAVEWAYARNKQDRDEQIATLKEIHNI